MVFLKSCIVNTLLIDFPKRNRTPFIEFCVFRALNVILKHLTFEVQFQKQQALYVIPYFQSRENDAGS
jgi:hypothetical protein